MNDFNVDEILAGFSIPLEVTVQVPAGKNPEKVVQIYSELLKNVNFEEAQLLHCLSKDTVMKAMAMNLARNKYGKQLI